MEDMEITPDEVTEEVDEVTEEPAPDPLAEERARIAERERELQKGFDEIARREREIQSRAPEPTPTDDDDEFDPEAMKVLERALAKTPYAQAVQNLYVETAEAELQRFAEKKGIDPDKLRDTIAEKRLLAGAGTSLAAVQSALKDAADILTAKTFDPEAERERIRAEEIQKLRDEGVRIEDVKPKRTEIGTGKADFFDEDLSPDERYRIALQKSQS